MPIQQPKESSFRAALNKRIIVDKICNDVGINCISICKLVLKTQRLAIENTIDNGLGQVNGDVIKKLEELRIQLMELNAQQEKRRAEISNKALIELRKSKAEFLQWAMIELKVSADTLLECNKIIQLVIDPNSPTSSPAVLKKLLNTLNGEEWNNCLQLVISHHNDTKAIDVTSSIVEKATNDIINLTKTLNDEINNKLSLLDNTHHLFIHGTSGNQ